MTITQSFLTTEIANLWPDNNIGEITPATSRQTLNDIVTAIFQPSLGVVIDPTPLSSNQGLIINQTASGTQSGGSAFIPGGNSYGLNLINVSSDNVTRPTGGGGGNKFSALLINHDYGGSALIGGRNTLDVYSVLTAGSSNSNNDHNYQASNFEFYTNVNDGGTSLSHKGSGFCIGGAAQLDSGATNWDAITFMEADVEVLSGASVRVKFGIQIDALSNDAVQGSQFDAMLAFTNESGAVGWLNGIQFNNAGGQQPIASNGSLMTTTGSATVAIGIDISSYTYTGNAIHTPGFAVAGTGQITGVTSLTLNGATSGKTVLSVTSTGGAAVISSGQSSSVTTLTVSDTVAGGVVTQATTNLSAANNSKAVFSVGTGVSNAFIQLVTLNGVATPTATLQWGTAITATTFNNGTSNIAIWENGLQLGVPTGGDKGIGTINTAAGIFTNTSLNSGVNGGTGGSLILNGATSGQSTLSVSATGGATTVSSGQSSTVNTLTVSDTVAGGSVIQVVTNGSSSNNSNAVFQASTGVSNAFLNVGVGNSAGTPAGNITWGSGIGSGLLFINAGAGTVPVTINNGLQVGAPTGGDPGLGNINVAGSILQNNSAYTHPDFVFEKEFTNNVTLYMDSPRAKDYQGRMDLDELRKYIKSNYRLPRIPDEPTGIFSRADIALEKIEELVLYTLDLHDRLTELENGTKN